VKSKAKPETKVKPEVKSKAKPETKVKPEVKSKAKPETKVKPEVKSKAKPETKVKPEVKSRAKPETKMKPERKHAITAQCTVARGNSFSETHEDIHQLGQSKVINERRSYRISAHFTPSFFLLDGFGERLQ
jgi:hypothetical protein